MALVKRPSEEILARIERLPKNEQRAEVMALVMARQLKAEHAAWILSLSVRQVQRLKKRFASGTDDWDRHGNSGKTPTNSTPQEMRTRVVELARTYAGLNDSQFHQQLTANHGISLSRQTVRRILRSSGLAPVWDRRRRRDLTQDRPAVLGAPSSGQGPLEAGLDL